MAHHEILPTPQNMVLGYLDSATPAVLTVESGDTITLTSIRRCGRMALRTCSSSR